MEAAAGHRVDEWREPVEKKLLEMFGGEAPVLECIKKLLRDTGSLIAGGGRPELYARILAIREIYANLDINVPAEGAARDPAYIARGRAIFEKAEAERKWNVNIPARKNYNNDAYRAAAINEADEKEFNDANLPPLEHVAPGAAAAPAAGAGNQAGGRRRRTYKKRKGSKFTRKMN